jgi:hypothetical protein
MFMAPTRKEPSGELVRWSGATAQPRLADVEPVELRNDPLLYLVRERHAQELLHDIVEQRQPALSLDPPPRPRPARRGRSARRRRAGR